MPQIPVAVLAGPLKLKVYVFGAPTKAWIWILKSSNTMIILKSE